MSNSTIKHDIKLQPAVIILLGFLAFGVCANAFSPAFSIKEAFAEGHDSTRGISSALSNIAHSILAIDCRS